MSHTYSIISCTYDGTRGAHNPRLLIIATVDSHRYPFASTWYQIQAANAVGGSDAVKEVLAAILLNAAVIYHQIPKAPLQQVPIFDSSDIPAPAPADSNAGRVSVPEALVGTWTA